MTEPEKAIDISRLVIRVKSYIATQDAAVDLEKAIAEAQSRLSAAHRACSRAEGALEEAGARCGFETIEQIHAAIDANELGLGDALKAT